MVYLDTTATKFGEESHGLRFPSISPNLGDVRTDTAKAA